MSSLNMTSIDEITMRLVHYFVTKENYQPIIVSGLENEIWLENTEKKYGVIRINSNYIHNNEQMDFDIFKAKAVIKQIKKKTLSLSCNTLNILLNVGDNVTVSSKDRHIDVCHVSDVLDLNKDNTLTEKFPEIKKDFIIADDEMSFFLNVTNDINTKTEEKNRIFEKVFKKKRIIITYALIIINILIYLCCVNGMIDVLNYSMNIDLVKRGEWWRLFTAAFFHSDPLHLFCNMYSLYIIGTSLENVIGKIKFIIVYIISILTASLLSGIINGGSITSIGASGAIFGLMGAMLYFGYFYRLYLGSVMTSQLIPVILINLFIGFYFPYIDNYAHIGGLIGGLFAGMSVGVLGKTNKRDQRNGIIVTTILIAFLIYMAFIR